MKLFLAAFWAEALKVRRSKVPLLTTTGFLILPMISGLFMIILKDPGKAKELGIISVKAQLVGGSADWHTFFGMMNLGVGVAGLILFSIITAWVFGREFSDHTVKELLALPTARCKIISAKLLVIIFLPMSITLLIFLVGLGIGALVDIPGFSQELLRKSFGLLLLIALLTTMLMPLVALIASAGRGYLPPLGWAFLTMALAQIAVVMGWGEWFPWAVPSLLSEVGGDLPEPLGIHSYLVVIFVFIIGVISTLIWWQKADQAA
jgi:ABC-2 type transport system permease protein